MTEYKEIVMRSGATVIRCSHPDYDGVIIGIHPAKGTDAEKQQLKADLETQAVKELTPKTEWDFI